jgi:1,4-alpha-glucan branching enzyme
VVTQRQSGTPVRFVFQKRGARSVCVVGDFNAWNPAVSPLRDDGSGVWTGTVALEPGLHEYMFVVDGIEFVADPAAVEYRPDGFGSRNAVLRI